MGQHKKTFERKEKKYPLTRKQYNDIRTRIVGHMKEDAYGLHTICSLYYDTEQYDLIRASMAKPQYREKFRVRSYGTPTNDSTVFVEIKKKINGVVNKRRVAIAAAEVTALIEEGKINQEVKTLDHQIFNEINWFTKRYQITPKVCIAYDRIALHDETNSSFRVTFDFNIRWRTTNLDLRSGSDGRLLAPEMDCLMEVKALGAFPLWFCDILSDLKIYPGSFSKYATCYKKNIISKGELTHVI